MPPYSTTRLRSGSKASDVRPGRGAGPGVDGLAPSSAIPLPRAREPTAGLTAAEQDQPPSSLVPGEGLAMQR